MVQVPSIALTESDFPETLTNTKTAKQTYSIFLKKISLYKNTKTNKIIAKIK
jgi:hypothetical protein